MKILYNLGRFNGGAPLSLLQYAKIAKKNGNVVIAVGEFSTCEVEYNRAGIKTIEIPCFYFRRPVRNFIGFWKLYIILKNERPDLIHATSYGIVPSKFISKVTGISTLYSIAGGKNAGKNITNGVFIDEELIVYSQENKEDLLKLDYPENLINLISNRLEVSFDDIDLKRYNNFENNDDKINILLISRLDSGVIKSVEYIIDLIGELAKLYPSIELDIVGDGRLKNIIKQKAEELNKSFGRNLVNIHGYSPNVKIFINNAHLVFGKGRSIIESILYNRISFVVGEDNTITKCSPQTLDHLYKYNFSGRNNRVLFSFDELIQLINKVITNNIDFTELEEVSTKVNKLYNIKNAEKKIIDLYQTIIIKNGANKKEGLFNAILFIVAFYFKKIRSMFYHVTKEN